MGRGCSAEWLLLTPEIRGSNPGMANHLLICLLDRKDRLEMAQLKKFVPVYPQINGFQDLVLPCPLMSNNWRLCV